MSNDGLEGDGADIEDSEESVDDGEYEDEDDSAVVEPQGEPAAEVDAQDVGETSADERGG